MDIDAMCEGCTQHCPEGFCKAYRDARYEALGMRRVDGWRLEGWYNGRWISIIKIGKLNYHPSSINWKAFGIEAEKLCNDLGVDYYIKESLRAEMNKP